MSDAQSAPAEGTELRGAEERGRPARRSLCVFGALVAGYTVALHSKTEVAGMIAPGISPAWFIGGAAASVLGAALIRGRIGGFLLLACVLCLGCAWFGVRVLDAPRDSLEGRIAPLAIVRGLETSVIVVVTGTVEEEPRPALPARGALAHFYRSSPSWRFTIQVDGFLDSAGTMHAARGRARVRAPSDGGLRLLVQGEPLRAGDRVLLHGQARLVSRPMNPGERDWRLWARQESIAADLHVPDTALMDRVSRERGAPSAAAGRVRSAIGFMEARAARAIGVRAPATEAMEDAQPAGNAEEHGAAGVPSTRQQARALLGAMMLGVREEHLSSVEPAFVRLGLAHLVAISGFNMVLLAGLVAFGVRVLGERGRVEGALVALAVLSYMLILPGEAPVQRGGVMTLAYIGARAIGRRYDALTVLGWIAVALALLRPMDVFGAGFQLSFGVVAALIAFSGSAYERLFGIRIRGVRRTALPIGPRTRALRLGMMARRGAGGVAESVKYAISAAALAWVVATPIVLFHTGVLSPLAIVFTLLLSPLFCVALFAGYVTMLVGIVAPEGAAWLRPVLDSLGVLIVQVVGLLDRAPGASVRVPALSLTACALMGAAAVYWLTRGHVRNRAAWLLAATAAAWTGAEVLLPRLVAQDRALRIDTLAVGDGTCHLLRSGTEAVLWDCGSMNPGAGVRLIPEAARALGASRVRTAIVTHANIDHFGALIDAAENLGVRRVLISEPFERLAAWAEREPRNATRSALAAAALLRSLRERDVDVLVVRAGDTVQIGTTRLEFLWPPLGAESPTPSAVNETSLVAVVTTTTSAGERSVVLTGDIGAPSIRSLLAGGLGQRSGTVGALELPHHGSFNSESVRLLGSLDPAVVIQSTGARRAMARSWDEARSGPRAPAWYTTARRGAVFVEVGHDGRVSHGAYRADETP